MTDWLKVATDYWQSQPSPHASELTNGEYPLAVKLATHLKFGGHASALEASAFWHEFKSVNQRLLAQGKEAISPEELGHLVDRIAPVSFTYHGRPPSLQELVRHRESEPAQVNKYYGDLPDQHYPHVTAAQMVKSLQAAHEPAMTHLQRPPNKLEAAQLVHSGLDPWEYYGRIGIKPGSTWGGDPQAPPTGVEGGGNWGGIWGPPPQAEPVPDTSRGTGHRLGGEQE